MKPWNRAWFLASAVKRETRRAGSWTGSGLSSTSFTSEKIVVFAPTPRPRETTAASVKTGLFTSRRAAYLRSSRKPLRTPEGAWATPSSGAGRDPGVARADWISAEKDSEPSSRLTSASASSPVCPSRMARACRCSSSWASSSTTSASWYGSRRRGARRSRTARRQSRIGCPHRTVHRGHERAPRVLLLDEHLAAGVGEPVIAAAALARPLDPASRHPAALLQPVQQRVQRSDVELDHPLAAPLDLLADVVSVPWPPLQQRQDEQLGAALLELAVQLVCLRPIWDEHIHPGPRVKTFAGPRAARPGKWSGGVESRRPILDN